MLPQVEILRPTKKLCGQELPLAQQRANQSLHHRLRRIKHVNSSVKRCRIVKDRIRLWKDGVCDLVMELCCALHNGVPAVTEDLFQSPVNNFIEPSGGDRMAMTS